jgi:hypothetical protein
MKLPIRGSYWVVDGRFLAGEYPWALAEGTSDSGGITSFVDLTELHEALPPYEARLAKDLRVTRKAIPDSAAQLPRRCRRRSI